MQSLEILNKSLNEVETVECIIHRWSDIMSESERKKVAISFAEVIRENGLKTYEIHEYGSDEDYFDFDDYYRDSVERYGVMLESGIVLGLHWERTVS